MQKIADKLNEQGYTSKRNCPFKPTGIREILTNPCYKGCFHYNRSSARGTNGFNRHLYKSDTEIVKYDCPAIVTTELWDKVQPKEKNKKRSSKSTRYLLSGKVVCGHCGGQIMHANRRTSHHKLYVSFYCPNNKLHKICDVKEIDMSRLEEFVLSVLCDELLSKEFIKKFSGEFPQLNSKKKAELSELTVQYNRVTKRCNKLINELENDCPEETATQISERLHILSKEKSELETAIADLFKTMHYIPDEADIQKAKEMFLSYCQQEENRPFVESLVRTNVKCVEVDNDGVTVTLLY